MNAAEVPNCRWVPADVSNYRQRPQAQEGGPYRLVVIHVTDGHADPMGDAQMWQQAGHGTSAHFVVGQAGEIIQCVALRFAAQHAHAANAYSVGVEHCARSAGSFDANDPGMPPTHEQYVASAWLVAYLLKAAGLPPTRDYVKGHKEADPATTHDDCPDGAPWNWPEYMHLVTTAYNTIGTVAPIA